MRLNEIYDEFKDRVQFYCVYIREAHPTDGWQLPTNIAQGVLYEQPKTIDAREELIQVCTLRLNLKMPMLLDDMSNEVDRLYAALPGRLYLLDDKGIVVFRTLVGSRGFLVEPLYEAIKNHLEVIAQR